MSLLLRGVGNPSEPAPANPDFTSDVQTADTATAINFTGTNSGSPADTYLWNWGDGNLTSGAGEGASKSHTYAVQGTYTVSYSLTTFAAGTVTKTWTNYITITLA